MIKPITFQGVGNFNANLYALEVKSRFANQGAAHGYYAGYGSELAASVVGNNIIVGTGAFVVCGRMSEVTLEETLMVAASNGSVGYIVAHLETYRPADDKNCTFIVKTASSFDAIPLTQEDVYAADADDKNKVYELPIYSFAISGGAITNLTRLLPRVADYETVKQIVDAANSAAANAVATAKTAVQTADGATATANSALTGSQAANETAASAVDTASSAKTTAEKASADVAELEQQIGERQGTTITINDTPVARLAADGFVDENDIININGGVA